MAKFKKLLFCFVLLLPLFAGIFLPTQTTKSNALEVGQATVIASKCNLYSEADFSSTKVTKLDDLQQPVLITLYLNDTVEIIEFNEDFAKVEFRDVEGWMYKYYLTQNDSQDVFPVFNGTIKKDTILYDVDKQSTGLIAHKESRVFIYQGYDKDDEWTAVQIVLEDGRLYSGFIATKDLEADGFSKILIVAITIIAAAVTIILSIVFIRKKSKKNRKNIV